MNLRNTFVQQLRQLDEEISDIAAQATSMFERARQAAQTGEALDADAIESASSDIAAREREVETLALRLLLLQQPVAKDLREVTGALKAVTDFRRIGDMSLDVCRLVNEMEGRVLDIQKGELASMSGHVAAMIAQAVQSYESRDVDAALRAAALDDDVDRCLADIRDTIIEAIFDGEVDAKDAVDLLMIAKYFERIGDHAESVAYWTEYVVEGTRKGEPLTVTR